MQQTVIVMEHDIQVRLEWLYGKSLLSCLSRNNKSPTLLPSLAINTPGVEVWKRPLWKMTYFVLIFNKTISYESSNVDRNGYICYRFDRISFNTYSTIIFNLIYKLWHKHFFLNLTTKHFTPNSSGRQFIKKKTHKTNTNQEHKLMTCIVWKKLYLQVKLFFKK